MTSHHVDSVQGLDGNKKIKGRKQHMIVDSQGYLMSVAVHEANVHARQVGAKRVIERLWFNFLSAKSCLTKLLCNLNSILLICQIGLYFKIWTNFTVWKQLNISSEKQNNPICCNLHSACRRFYSVASGFYMCELRNVFGNF
jgi:transposase